MKTAILIGISTVFLASGPVMAGDSQPVELTDAQMDTITAGSGFGKTIIDVTGKSFGELIGPAKKAGTSFHSNYAGGAKALVEAVTGPGHPIPGS